MLNKFRELSRMFLYGAPIKIEKVKDFAKRELTLHGTGRLATTSSSSGMVWLYRSLIPGDGETAVFF
jgi:hypothetical protein